MTDEQKRAEVAKKYPGPRWAKRVKAMSDSQIYAIWVKMQNAPKDKKDEDGSQTIEF